MAGLAMTALKVRFAEPVPVTLVAVTVTVVAEKIAATGLDALMTQVEVLRL